MKSFMKLFFIFIVMVLSFIIEPQILHTKDLQTVNYIQNNRPESVEIISNNLFDGEIYNFQEKNSSNFSGNTPQVLVFNKNYDNLIKNNTQFTGSFIHTLSTNLKEVQQIRAP